MGIIIPCRDTEETRTHSPRGTLQLQPPTVTTYSTERMKHTTVIFALAIVLLAGIANHGCGLTAAAPAPDTYAAAEDRGSCGKGMTRKRYMGSCRCIPSHLIRKNGHLSTERPRPKKVRCGKGKKLDCTIGLHGAKCRCIKA